MSESFCVFLESSLFLNYESLLSSHLEKDGPYLELMEGAKHYKNDCYRLLILHYIEQCSKLCEDIRKKWQ